MKKIIGIIFILTILGGAFYWYEIRPSHIKKICADFAMTKSLDESGNTWDPSAYDDQYKRCSREHGL